MPEESLVSRQGETLGEPARLGPTRDGCENREKVLGFAAFNLM